MLKNLGSNSQLLLGAAGLLLSISLIIYGLKNSESNKTFFNISRLLALLSVAGIWYFGNILTKNTTNEIEENKLKTAQVIRKSQQLLLGISEANKKTEEAKRKTEELKVDVQKAQQEVENSKKQTALIQLEIEKAHAEAERAKLERERLKDKLDYIKNISATVSG